MAVIGIQFGGSSCAFHGEVSVARLVINEEFGQSEILCVTNDMRAFDLAKG
jgi:hypothetical protein